MPVLPARIASSERDFDTAFATLVQQRANALVVHNDAFFSSRHKHIVALAARYAVPAIYYLRDFVEAGGLVSYGASVLDGYRQVDTYTGRILKGSRRHPVQLQSKRPKWGKVPSWLAGNRERLRSLAG